MIDTISRAELKIIIVLAAAVYLLNRLKDPASLTYVSYSLLFIVKFGLFSFQNVILGIIVVICYIEIF
jgi:hypothetical protein